MKKRIIILIVFLVIVSLFSIGRTFSKYINTTKWDYSYNSKDFYFTSDYLSEEDRTLYYNSWDESDITFNISNALNKDTYTSDNITYEVSCISNDATCLINGKSKINSTLSGNNYSNEELKLSLNNFKDNANVTVIARSIKPYKKTLQVTFDISKSASINDIDYAVLETNGKLSIFKKSDDPNREYPLPVILNGKIDKNTLNQINKNEKWLYDELKKQDIGIDTIFYGFYQNNNLYIIEKNQIK